MSMKNEIKKEIKKWKSFTIYGKVVVSIISFVAILVSVFMLIFAIRAAKANTSWNVEKIEYIARY